MFYGSLDNDKLLRPLRKYYSADGSMEIKVNTQTGVAEFVTYIGGNGYTAPIILKSNGSTQNYLYLQRDYQGSIVAITDAAGAVVEKRLFDAWGSLINYYNASGAPFGGWGALDRGYTGHEHLQSVGLIHMNGRLYDPKLHRFLQTDNYVQDPSNTQNYNRYGYVLNNPLKYIDPSGEQTSPNCDTCGGNNLDNTQYGNGIIKSILEDPKVKEWLDRNLSARNFDEAGTAVGKAARDATNFVVGNVRSFFKGLFGGKRNSGPPSNRATNVNMNSYTSGGGGDFNLGNNAMISQYNEHSVIPVNTVGSQVNWSNTFSTIGLFGDVASYSNGGSFRLASNGLFSPKYYSSGWNGGSRAGITTYNLSRLGGKISAGAGFVTTGMSYYNISNGDTSPITWADATVGTAGVISSGAYYLKGIEIPVVGEFVAIYGALRLSWDFGFNMGYYYGPSTWYGTNDNKWFK